MNRNICSSPCCSVITKRLCNKCNKASTCKTHKICVECKSNRKTNLPVLDPLSPDYAKELFKKAARDKYRAKMGIPLDAPLCPRGGARHIVNHDEKTRQEMDEKSRQYQQIYQANYRKQKRDEREYNNLLKLKQIVIQQMQTGQNRDGYKLYLQKLENELQQYEIYHN